MTVKEFLEKAKPDSVSILWTYYKVAEGTPSELKALGNDSLLGATITDVSVRMTGGSIAGAGEPIIGSYWVRVDMDDESAKELLESKVRKVD